MGLRLEFSAHEDCIYCGGTEQLVEMFEWEVFTTAGTDELGPCGVSSGQATAMDTLRTEMRRMESPATVWGRISHRVRDFSAVQDDWSRQVLFHATVDPAGSVRFERQES